MTRRLAVLAVLLPVTTLAAQAPESARLDAVLARVDGCNRSATFERSKIGSNEFVRLRSVAQQSLGPRFDLRTFHTQVLTTGSVPMTVLGAKLDRWIAATR